MLNLKIRLNKYGLILLIIYNLKKKDNPANLNLILTRQAEYLFSIKSELILKNKIE